MLKRTEEIAGTSLQGYTPPTTRAELTDVLGEPIQYEGGDKVTIEWGIRFGSTVATVYDWKRYELGTPEQNEEWVFNIGGTDPKAVALVNGLLDLARKVAN
jgi:Ni/Co efflux regulator RcnB